MLVQNVSKTSKYNSFSFTVEDGEVKFRGKRLPQDTESSPRSGIRIVKKDVVFEAVGAANFRIENLQFDVFPPVDGMWPVDVGQFVG